MRKCQHLCLHFKEGILLRLEGSKSQRLDLFIPPSLAASLSASSRLRLLEVHALILLFLTSNNLKPVAPES